MNYEGPEAREQRTEINLMEVPNWHTEPGTGLWPFGQSIENIDLRHEEIEAFVDPEIIELRKKVEVHQTPTFFSGPFANVEHISLGENGISIETSGTDFFTYLAAAYSFRDRQGQNPIRPLAVQATLFSPDGERMIIERRPETLADNPNKLSVFGGALKPTEDPTASIQAIINRKLGLDVGADQIKPSGLVRENIDNIYCLTYSIRLNNRQFSDGRERATAANRTSERMFYQISTNAARGSIESMFQEKRPIPEWDPNAYYSILYALDAQGKRTADQLEDMVRQTHDYMRNHPMSYTYPMEKYLPSEDASTDKKG